MIVYKYQLQPVGFIAELRLPKEAEILHVVEQHGVMCLWALLDTTAALELRKFAVIPTGVEFKRADIPGAEALAFISTVLMRNGSLVFHVFEVHS